MTPRLVTTPHLTVKGCTRCAQRPRPPGRYFHVRRASYFLFFSSLLLFVIYAFAPQVTSRIVTASLDLLAPSRLAEVAYRDSVTSAAVNFLADRAVRVADYPTLSGAEISRLTRASYSSHLSASRAVGRNGKGGLDLTVVPRTSPYYVSGWRRGLLAPRALAVIDSLGQRFREETAAAGLPPARFVITSGYRSAAHQAQLREINENAAAGTSSHEFGGSFDITYLRFAPAPAIVDTAAFTLGSSAPDGLRRALTAELHLRQTRWAEAMIAQYPEAYQAALGRALIALEAKGLVYALRETGQPCFHVTAR